MNYQEEYNSIIDFRLENRLEKSKDQYTELHHIKPKCFFPKGTSLEEMNKDNLVNLTISEHFMAHYYLFKIYENDSKNYYKSESMFRSMQLTLEHDKSMYECSKIYEQEKINYYKVLSKIEQEYIKLICYLHINNGRKSLRPINFKIYTKLNAIKAKYNNDKLSEESIQIFNELKCEELLYNDNDRELININEICDYYIENNRKPDKRSIELSEKDLGRKLNRIKHKYNNDKLSLDSIKLFKDLNCFILLANLEELEIIDINTIHEYIKEYNKIPSTTNKDKEIRRLSGKVYTIRKRYRNDTISDNILNHIEKLNILDYFK